MIRQARILIGAASCSLTSPGSTAGGTPVPDTMLAVAFDRAGGPEVLTVHHLPVPKPGAGQVLIAVHATGVNVWEADRREHAGSDTHFPVILGNDGSGTVAALGASVHGFKVGDEVYARGRAF